MPEYPKRPKFFAFKFCRLMAKVCLANEIGAETCWLLAVIAQCEDAKRYTSPVTYFNDHLAPLVGAGSVDALDRMRSKAVKSGWLNYTPGRKHVAGQYFVTIPPQFCGINDGSSDEDTSEYLPQNCGDKPEECAERSRRQVRNILPYPLHFRKKALPLKTFVPNRKSVRHRPASSRTRFWDSRVEENRATGA